MWFVILKTRLPEAPSAWSAQPEMLLVADERQCSILESRPAAKMRAASPSVYPPSLPHLITSGCRLHRAQKTHPAVSELVLTLLSMIWDTEVRTFPARTGTGGAKRLGNRRP